VLVARCQAKEFYRRAAATTLQRFLRGVAARRRVAQRLKASRCQVVVRATAAYSKIVEMLAKLQLDEEMEVKVSRSWARRVAYLSLSGESSMADAERLATALDEAGVRFDGPRDICSFVTPVMARRAEALTKMSAEERIAVLSNLPDAEKNVVISASSLCGESNAI